MPRKRRVIGPRKKLDIATLSQLSQDERLNLLVRSLIECGGTSEQDAGKTYRRLLSEAQSHSHYSSHLLQPDP